MPELISDAIAALRAEASAYPGLVQLWMRIMALSFFGGLLIAWWDRRALWAAGMAAMTAALLIVAKITYPDLTRDISGAVIHLVLWPVFALALWRSGPARHMIFAIWRYWVSALIAVSLVLDFRILLGWF